MTEGIRVRFAPSPTGEPHVGNIRTAIYDWLLARGSGGSFIIRIEDTDQARKVEGAADIILDVLGWLGLDWDEGPDIGGKYEPYYQSQRRESYYSPAVKELLARGKAYKCYCTPQRLAELRRGQTGGDSPTGYDRKCRGLTEAEWNKHESDGAVPVVRFAMPLDGVTVVKDLIRGEVSFENRLLDDFVVLKSDGFPTYHLASVVDDHAMKITRVLRAEEWLPSAPRHLRIYEALEWDPPLFAHLPIILAPDRSKLSKRHGATSVLEYRRMGYLPEAMINFLTLLGWSLDDRTDVISVLEMKKQFSLERVSKSPAIFNLDKLNWLNGHYIRQLTHDRLADALLDFWQRYPPEEIPEPPDREHMLRIVPIIQERLKTLSDAAPLVPFFFTDTVEYKTQELVQKGMDAGSTKMALQQALVRLEALDAFDASSIEGQLRSLVEELDIKVGQLFGSLRVALTGLRVSPPLFETMEVLGRDRTLTGINRAIQKL